MRVGGGSVGHGGEGREGWTGFISVSYLPILGVRDFDERGSDQGPSLTVILL